MPRTSGRAAPPSRGGRSSLQAPRRACPERQRLRVRSGRSDQIKWAAVRQRGAPEAPAPVANAAARLRGRTYSGAATRTARPGGSRDTRQHQGSKPAAAAGAAGAARSALRVAQLGARAGASCAGKASKTLADMREPLSVKPDRQQLARARSAAAVAAVAPLAVQPNEAARTRHARGAGAHVARCTGFCSQHVRAFTKKRSATWWQPSGSTRHTSRAQLRALAAPVLSARVALSALPRREWHL